MNEDTITKMKNATNEEIEDFVKGLYAHGRKPCELFGMTWESLSKLEQDLNDEGIYDYGLRGINPSTKLKESIKETK